MLWFTPVFVAFFLYFSTKNLKNRSSLYLVGMVAGWCVNLVAFLFFTIRHNYYYHVVSRYFSISKGVRRALSEVPVPLSLLARMMNLGTLLIIFCVLCFAISYTFPNYKGRYYVIPLSIPLALQLLLYDPAIYKQLYLFLAGAVGDFAWIEALKGAAYNVSRVTNALYLLAAVFILCYHLAHCKLQVLRLINFCVLVSFLCFLFVFYSLFRDMPLFWVNITTVCDYVTYTALDIASNRMLMQYFPYLCMGGVCIIAFAFYRYSSIEQTFHSRQLKITSNLNQFGVGFSVVSHSLKNQLVCIEEEACQLEEVLDDRAQLLQGISAIQQYTRTMFDSITQLHSQVKIQRMELALISLTGLCREVAADNVHLFSRVTLFPFIPEHQVNCFASKRHLRECIQNLLHNAVEAVQPGVGKVWFTLEEEKNWAIITIRDNGCGISKTEQSRIFQPFYSTKATSANWGIGLSTSSKIIEAHGGKILVSSEPGQGSTFRILLSTVY